MVFEQINSFPVFHRITALQRWQVTCHCRWPLYGDRSNEFTHKSRQTLGAFAEVRKATVTFVMSVRPSARNNSAPTERTSIKFDVWVFFENLSRKLKFSLKSDKINRYFTWRSMDIYHTSLSSSQNKKCFRQNLHRKSKHTFCVH